LSARQHVRERPVDPEALQEDHDERHRQQCAPDLSAGLRPRTAALRHLRDVVADEEHLRERHHDGDRGIHHEPEVAAVEHGRGQRDGERHVAEQVRHRGQAERHSGRAKQQHHHRLPVCRRAHGHFASRAHEEHHHGREHHEIEQQ
jgi:hypothetical protein